MVTVAKADGSGNTTVLEYKSVAAPRIMTVVPLATFKFSEGGYIVSTGFLISFPLHLSYLSYIETLTTD